MSRHFLLREYTGKNAPQLGRVVDARGNRIEPGDIFRGERLSVPLPLRVPFENPDVHFDLAYASYSVPVATKPIADVVAALCGDEVQRLPVVVGSNSLQCDVLNFLCLGDCILHEDSVFTRIDPGGPPELVGMILSFFRLSIDDVRAPKCSFFRLREWPQGIITDDRGADALRGKKGVMLQPLPYDRRPPPQRGRGDS